ncbi:uncharacterized protein LOC112685596 [Sipha flava]|uniref:Uncharacterized protein LOC112685596 n=1 Tax=Sipha flava TaxID=143950 RepID=A0A8B8FS60_9HEMI|nr:uncharacterized protein LOC112685596 [Sipha flava]
MVGQCYQKLEHDVAQIKLFFMCCENLVALQQIRPDSYTLVFGVQRNTQIIKDNLGFMYYKNKKTQILLYSDLTERCFERSMQSYTPCGINLKSIVK